MDKNALASEIAVITLMEALVRAMYPLKSSREIQPLQWSILRYLSESSPQRCTPTLISKYVGLTMAPVSRAVATLKQRGLVQTDTAENDRRTRLLSLTEAGKRALHEDPMLDVAARLAKIAPEDRRVLGDVLKTLIIEKEEIGNDADG